MMSLTESQRAQLLYFEEIARDLNRGVNLYSSASASDFKRRHTTHALMLSMRSFPAGASVVDWGTGGGVPGIPLAIAFPDVPFVLVDTIEKKIQAVRTMVRRLGLSNVQTWCGRAEKWDGRTTHSVSRATSSLEELWSWHRRVAQPGASAGAGEWDPGLLCFKGGDLSHEISAMESAASGVSVNVTPLATLTDDPYFDSKSLVHVRSREC